MNEEATIRIDIQEIKCSSPPDKLDPKQMGLKVCKARNLQPIIQKFAFSPKIMPMLKDHVEEVQWNSASKNLTVIIEETPTFAAYRWFSGINDRSENLRGIDIDIDADVVYLSFLDKCDREVARFKFKGITLENHECLLKKHNTEVAAVFGIEAPQEDTPLAHALELRYTKVEQMDIKGPDDRELDGSPDQTVDEEWRTLVINK